MQLYKRDGSICFLFFFVYWFDFLVLFDRDGRLAEGDQILAIDGQVLEAAISHQAAIGILQRARGVVDLVVARGVNPEVPHIPLISLQQQQQQQQQQPSSIVEFAQQQQQQQLLLQEKKKQLSSPGSSTRSRSSQSSQQSAGAASSSSRSASPQSPQQQQHQQQPTSSSSSSPRLLLPAVSLLSASSSSSSSTSTITTTTNPIKNNNGVDVVEIITTANLAAPSLGRSPSALSDGSKTGGDMVVCAILLLFCFLLPSFFLKSNQFPLGTSEPFQPEKTEKVVVPSKLVLSFSFEARVICSIPFWVCVFLSF